MSSLWTPAQANDLDIRANLTRGYAQTLSTLSNQDIVNRRGIRNLGGRQISTPIRNTGNDSMGTVGGTGGIAFKTVGGAMNALFQEQGLQLFTNGGWDFDCTGFTGQWFPTSGYEIPQFQSLDQPRFDNTDFYLFKAPIRIVAAPAKVGGAGHIVAGTINSQTLDATTGLLTITANGTPWTAHAWAGAYIVDSAGTFAAIYDNSTSTITTTGTAALVAPLDVFLVGGQINNNVDNPTFVQTTTSMVLAGVSMVASPIAVGVSGLGGFLAICTQASPQYAGPVSGVALAWIDCQIQGAIDPFIQRCAYENCVIGAQGSTFSLHNYNGVFSRGYTGFLSCIIAGCTSAFGSGALTGFANDFIEAEYALANCLITGSAADGVRFPRNSQGVIDHCKVDSATASGIFIESSNPIVVTNNAPSGLAAINTYGCNVQNGGRLVKGGTGNTVTGTSGNLKVGGLSVSTWGNLSSVGSLIDYLTGGGTASLATAG